MTYPNEYFCDICQETTTHLDCGTCEGCNLTKEQRDKAFTPEGYVYNG